MRVVLIMASCLGLIACMKEIPPDRERAAESEAQRALLKQGEEFNDFQKIRREEQRKKNQTTLYNPSADL